MQYMGGKARQAAHIVPIILEHATDCAHYLEPFIGGASIFSRVAPHFPGKAWGSDTHPDLVLMWQAARDGWVPPTELAREEYAELRHAESSALRAFAGFGVSFGGKWFGGYAETRNGPDYCGLSHRGVIKKAAGMAHARIIHEDYRDLYPHKGWLVYCDPPYAGTTGYGARFDSAEFWATMREWANAGATVLVSEYNAPDWAEQVWERQAYGSLNKSSNLRPVEKLFRVNPGA